MKSLFHTCMFLMLAPLICPVLLCGQITASATQTYENVIINGTELSSEQLAQLESMYKVKAQPGNYWYDSKSGLYGIVGQAAYGFMYPDHNFGKLDRNASNGNAGYVSLPGGGIVGYGN